MSLQSHHRALDQSTPLRIEVVDPFEHPTADTPERLHETLVATRAGIRGLDTQLVSLMARRVELARTLQAVASGASVEPDAELSAAVATEAARQGLPELKVRAVFACIAQMSGDSRDGPA